MSYDAWVARVSLTLAAIAAGIAAARGVWRVLRSTYRVHAMLLGQGQEGDPDYRPGIDARMAAMEADLRLVRQEVAAGVVTLSSEQHP